MHRDLHSFTFFFNDAATTEIYTLSLHDALPIFMWVASLRTTAVLALLFTLLAATFFVLGAGDVAHNEGLTTLGGYLGLVTAAVAWYACLAGVSASTFGHAVLPNPPLYKL